MTQFSSGKHARLTTDGVPWQQGFPGLRRFERKTAGAVWNPRPEFDRPLTNRENPILLRFRMLRSITDVTQAAPEWIRALDLGHYDQDFTLRQRQHARKVLTRLAALR